MPVQIIVEGDQEFYLRACNTCEECQKSKACPNKSKVLRIVRPRVRSRAQKPKEPFTEGSQSPEPDVEPSADSEILQGTTSSHESSIWSAWTKWEGQVPETNNKDFVSARSIREVFKAFRGGREDVKEVRITDFLNRWTKNKEYIAALIKKLKKDGKEVPPGSKETDLVYTVKNGGDHEGTWLHKRLAVEYARVLFPEFAVWLDGKFLNHFDLDTTDPQKRSKIWKATTLTLRESDGFISANAMRESYVAPGDYRTKRFVDFVKRDETQAYIKALATYLAKRQSRELCQARTTGARTDLSYCRELVIDSCRGGNDRGSTWIHPRLAVCFARWLDPHFAVWLDGWFLDITGQTRSPSLTPDVEILRPERPLGPPPLVASPVFEIIELNPAYSPTKKHLYAMTIDGHPGVLKVGQSERLAEREDAISGSMGRSVRVVAFWRHAGDLETHVHRALKTRRNMDLNIRSKEQGKEFFNVELDELKACVKNVHSERLRKRALENQDVSSDEADRDYKRRCLSFELDERRLAVRERELTAEGKQLLHDLVRERHPRAVEVFLKILEAEHLAALQKMTPEAI